MTDLETLRPEVQKALDDLGYFLTGTHNHDDFYTIHAELRRLATRNAELEAKVTRDHDWISDLLAENKKAEAELAALKARIKHAPRADGQRVFDLLCLPIEFDGTLALVKMEG